MPLPTPVGRQREVLYLSGVGHHAVLGTAGSGKTTLAILRAAYLSDPTTDHGGKTLLITFSRTLVSYLRYLQERALSGVVTENYHKFARGYLASRRRLGYGCICTPEQVSSLVSSAVSEVAKAYKPHSFFRTNTALFVDEIRWIEQHGIDNVDDYQEVKRVGRSGFRIKKGVPRQIVYEILTKYKELRTRAGKTYDWDDLASAVRQELAIDTSARRYKHVIIDEGQDLSPEALRSLVAAVPADGSVTFFGDVAQQIYGRRLSWRSAGLRVRKAWEFKENYRNTRPISRLALAISEMPYFTDVADLVEPTAPTADGPLPALVECSDEDAEIEFVLRQAAAAAKTRSVAILFRKREYEKLISNRLPAGSVRLHREMKRWIAGVGIRYGTYHSAKGLEFDAVYLPFCGRDRFPDQAEIDSFGEEDAAIEDGRLLYVGVTRAKVQLVLTYSGSPSSLLPTAQDLYQRTAL